MLTMTKSKIDDANRFPDFMGFLLEQKRIIEYESADVCMKKMGLSGQRFH